MESRLRTTRTRSVTRRVSLGGRPRRQESESFDTRRTRSQSIDTRTERRLSRQRVIEAVRPEQAVRPRRSTSEPRRTRRVTVVEAVRPEQAVRPRRPTRRQEDLQRQEPLQLSWK